MRPRSEQPELIAPAGDWTALRAAAVNGADAVYFGLCEFSARQRAKNFTPEELPQVIDYLHAHNVRGYVTLNTLIFSEELPRAMELLAAIAAAGADAVIVQDLGLAHLAQQLVPDLPIHASTQMTLADSGGIAIATKLGIRRVILPRELSVSDINQIAKDTDIELEVFVHGALCISVSGQCLASRVLGGRSANRGVCAQPCRLPYRLVVDGIPRATSDCPFPLSPKDLAAYDLLGELLELGVRGFKIEGRLKDAEYVAITTQVYRAALDAAVRGKPFRISPRQEIDLAQVFSRGFCHGFLDGPNHQALVGGRTRKHRGVRVGTVTDKSQRGLIVKIEAPHRPVKPGDGLLIEGPHTWEAEQGGRVSTVKPAPSHGNGCVELNFWGRDIDLHMVVIGSTVWRTNDPAVARRLRESYARDRVARPIALTARIHAALGEPLRIAVRDTATHEVVVSWDHPLQRAEKHPLSLALLRDQLGRLGGTPFVLQALAVEKLDPVMVPKSVLNNLRRQAVEELTRLRAAESQRRIAGADVLDRMRAAIRPPKKNGDSAHRGLCLHVLVRTPEQLAAVLTNLPRVLRPPQGRAFATSLVYCDMEDLSSNWESVERCRAAEVSVGLTTPRLVTPGSENVLARIAGCAPDAVLIRNLGSLAYFRQCAPHIPLIGDASLNAANELSADVFLRSGLTRLTPATDLDWDEMKAMTTRLAPEQIELIVHQHVPMFHTTHCLFAALLSTGRDRRSCGRPCREYRQKVVLRDRVGAEHPVLADAGCRNTIFHWAAQCAARIVGEVIGKGIRHFRIELLRETAEETATILDCYVRLLSGDSDTEDIWRRLRTLDRSLCTGTLARPET